MHKKHLNELQFEKEAQRREVAEEEGEKLNQPHHFIGVSITTLDTGSSVN